MTASDTWDSWTRGTVPPLDRPAGAPCIEWNAKQNLTLRVEVVHCRPDLVLRATGARRP